MKFIARLAAFAGAVAFLVSGFVASPVSAAPKKAKTVTVHGYTRKTKTGKVVTVKPYTRKAHAAKTVHVAAHVRHLKSGKTVLVHAHTRTAPHAKKAGAKSH